MSYENRNLIPEAYKWDLSSILAGDKAWEDLFEEVSAKAEQYGKYAGMTDRAVGLLTRLSAASSFALPEISALSEKTLRGLSDQPRFAAYRRTNPWVADLVPSPKSVVRDMETDGPVTRTLIPMAALDDLVGALVFFLVIAFVSAHISSQGIPVAVILLLVFLPVVIGAVTGFLTGKLLRHTRTNGGALTVMVLMLLASAGVAFFLNSLLPAPVLNFMLIGMSFSTAFANMISEEQLQGIMKSMNPVIGLAMIVVILNLGAPLDYHLIFGAGIYTAVYIAARAVGKYCGAWFGASISHAPGAVRRYLGFTLLPHSGVSLVFTGIAVSVLNGPAPECAAILQGTIAAAAVINEILAVFIAKKGFEWAGELHQAKGGLQET